MVRWPALRAAWDRPIPSPRPSPRGRGDRTGCGAPLKCEALSRRTRRGISLVRWPALRAARDRPDPSPYPSPRGREDRSGCGAPLKCEALSRRTRRGISLVRWPALRAAWDWPDPSPFPFPRGDLRKIRPGFGITGRIPSAPRFNEGWIPAFAGMTKGYAKVSRGRGDRTGCGAPLKCEALSRRTRRGISLVRWPALRAAWDWPDPSPSYRCAGRAVYRNGGGATRDSTGLDSGPGSSPGQALRRNDGGAIGAPEDGSLRFLAALE